MSPLPPDFSNSALGQFEFHGLLWEVGRHHFVSDLAVIVFDVVLPEQFRDQNLQLSLCEPPSQARPSAKAKGQTDERMDLLAGVRALVDVHCLDVVGTEPSLRHKLLRLGEVLLRVGHGQMREDDVGALGHVVPVDDGVRLQVTAVGDGHGVHAQRLLDARAQIWHVLEHMDVDGRVLVRQHSLELTHQQLLLLGVLRQLVDGGGGGDRGGVDTDQEQVHGEDGGYLGVLGLLEDALQDADVLLVLGHRVLLDVGHRPVDVVHAQLAEAVQGGDVLLVRLSFVDAPHGHP